MTRSVPSAKRDYRLLFGPAAAGVLTIGIIALGYMVPGYNQVRQTVSEIGELGSPARVPFAVMLVCVAGCLLIFAVAVRDLSIATQRSAAAAYLIGCMGLSAAGVGIFAFPHPLHNVFGLSELIGYQAPLVFALTWKRDPEARNLVALSWIAALIIYVAIVLNLSGLIPDSVIWKQVKPVHGIAQRILFAGWFGWCAVAGLLLLGRNR
jgi:hypothetical membrane protein